MRQLTIESICRHTVTLTLLAGIGLLYSKGIVPVYLIILLFLSGGIVGFFFRALSLIVKFIAVSILAKLLI